MTEPESPREGVAEAITDLGEQTRNLVRIEVGAARREMWDKAKESAPAIGLAGIALGLGVCAAASACSPGSGSRNERGVLPEWVPAAPQWHLVNELHQRAAIVIARPADALYEMISDVTRMGEWSPVCTGCWWDEGEGPRVGAWFTGRNEIPGRTWETHCEVVAADPARAFAFCVGGDRVRWGYEFAPVEGGTEVTETWEFLPAGLAFFEERFGPDAPAQVAERVEAARTGMPATLEALKRVAEGS